MYGWRMYRVGWVGKRELDNAGAGEGATADGKPPISDHVLSISRRPQIRSEIEGKDHRGLMVVHVLRQSFLGLCHSAAVQLQCQPAPMTTGTTGASVFNMEDSETPQTRQ
jgi:hypothetical protein